MDNMKAAAFGVPVFVAGATVVIVVVISAIRTVILPRAHATMISRFLFIGVRKLFDLRIRFADTYEERDQALALYAPLCLVLLPGVWLTFVVVGFTLMLWAVGVGSWLTALELSGSSITTLGFVGASDFVTIVLSVSEAVVGLGLVALLISYLPSIYSSFQRRELAVALLEVRAGDPPSAVTMLRRHHTIGDLDRLTPLFSDWEVWFADVEETHTSQASLCFFRSPLPGRSWVTAAGTVLDCAAILLSSLDIERRPEPQLCIRAGYLSLRRVADFFALPHDPDPAPDAPIAVDRSEFEAALDELAADGIPIKQDRDQCWRDFAGWRVNYDQVLIALTGLTMAPYAPWSSDRSIRVRVRPIAGRSRRASRSRAQRSAPTQ